MGRGVEGGEMAQIAGDGWVWVRFVEMQLPGGSGQLAVGERGWEEVLGWENGGGGGVGRMAGG